MTERRFTDEDVDRILARAAETEAALLAAGSERSWTLAEIQRVGLEAGLAPQAIAAAAVSLDRGGSLARDQRFLGLPVAVAHTVALDRALGDEEWARLVGELRDTFDAQGRERVAGRRREWGNGNLRVTYEPEGDGAFLAFRTRKGDARPLLNLAAGVTVASAASAAFVHFTSGDVAAVTAAAVSGAVALGALVASAIRLPSWAGTRARQFASVARYARQLGAG